MTDPKEPSPSLDALKYSLCWIVASMVERVAVQAQKREVSPVGAAAQAETINPKNYYTTN
jgi:hypothetical protein